MLCGISDESCDDAQRMLSLLCLSPRPLAVEEVIDALAVDLDGLERYDPDRKLERTDDLFRICPGLIEIIDREGLNSSTHNSHENENNVTGTQVVRIAHFSVQEYLVSERIKYSSAKVFAISAMSQHVQISKTCLLYLLHDAFLQQPLTPDLIEQFPFARYAAEYWHYHYKQAGGELEKQLTERFTNLLMSDKSIRRWVRLCDPDKSDSERTVCYDGTPKEPASPIYYASLLGLDQVVADIVSRPHTEVNTQGGCYGNALQAASRNGHEQIVQILLDAGAEANTQGGIYGNALAAASGSGHEQIVRILLNARAELNTRSSGNALEAAVYADQHKMVQILLDAGADVNFNEGYSLRLASRQGQEKIIQILLDMGADVNAQRENYGIDGNALEAASLYGHEKVVQILLGASADVNAQSEGWGNGLQAASISRHEKIIQILLGAGAEVNAQGGQYGNALQAASDGGTEEIIHILLGAGAEVNAQGGVLGNALQAASASGSKKIVQILLGAGAEVNAEDGGKYGNALQAASAGGHEEIVQILIDAGAKVNARQYASILEAISGEDKRDEVVQLLLEKRADITYSDKD